jgi:hypothetical protein
MAVIPAPLRGPAAHAAQANTRQQFANLVAEVKAKYAAKAAKRPKAVMPAPAPFDIEAARAELARLERSHSTAYQFADDRAAYQEGVAREQSIAALRTAIAQAEQRAA